MLRKIIIVIIAITFLTMILDNIVITMIFQLYVDLYLLIAMIIFSRNCLSIGMVILKRGAKQSKIQ